MTDYVLDLAFDADETREYQGLFHPLQAGLVAVTHPGTGQGDPQWLTRFEAGDLLHFRVWDISLVTTGSTLLDFWAGFFAVHSTSRLAEKVSDQPNPLVFAASQLFTVNLTEVRTSVYTPVRAGWIVGDNNAPLGRTLTLTAVPSKYVLQVRIEIRTPSGDLRSYVYDPEVFIGPSGG